MKLKLKKPPTSTFRSLPKPNLISHKGPRMRTKQVGDLTWLDSLGGEKEPDQGTN